MSTISISKRTYSQVFAALSDTQKLFEFFVETSAGKPDPALQSVHCLSANAAEGLGKILDKCLQTYAAPGTPAEVKLFPVKKELKGK